MQNIVVVNSYFARWIEFVLKDNEDTGEEFLKKEGGWRRNTSRAAKSCSAVYRYTEYE